MTSVAQENLFSAGRIGDQIRGRGTEGDEAAIGADGRRVAVGVACSAIFGGGQYGRLRLAIARGTFAGVAQENLRGGVLLPVRRSSESHKAAVHADGRSFFRNCQCRLRCLSGSRAESGVRGNRERLRVTRAAADRKSVV